MVGHEYSRDRSQAHPFNKTTLESPISAMHTQEAVHHRSTNYQDSRSYLRLLCSATCSVTATYHVLLHPEELRKNKFTARYTGWSANRLEVGQTFAKDPGNHR